VKKTLLIPLAAVLLLAVAGGAAADPGVHPTEIVIGQTCALGGPAQSLGLGMRAGLLACFESVNAAGGVNGQKIRLVSRDDGYEPDLAVANTRALLDQEQVFLLIGGVGTPTAKAIVPITDAAGVPFFGPFTGAEFLRNPFDKYVVNVRGSYFQEMETQAAYLVDKLGYQRIACFYQNDGYGKAGLEGIEKALARRNMQLAATGSYERNTTAVKGGLMAIKGSEPQAVVMVGTYQPCAEFIKLAKSIGMADVTYSNISFVGTDALLAELGDAGEGCIISQVVCFPWDLNVPLVAEYTANLAKHQPDSQPGFVSLEGYMVGKLFCKVLERCSGSVTREGFLGALAGTDRFDLGGVSLQFGPQDHQGMDTIYMTVIRGGKVVPLDSNPM
jgi:ABC-type branched-subunit amino acid transport system substrate-binding protein